MNTICADNRRFVELDASAAGVSLDHLPAYPSLALSGSQDTFDRLRTKLSGVYNTAPDAGDFFTDSLSTGPDLNLDFITPTRELEFDLAYEDDAPLARSPHGVCFFNMPQSSPNSAMPADASVQCGASRLPNGLYSPESSSPHSAQPSDDRRTTSAAASHHPTGTHGASHFGMDGFCSTHCCDWNSAALQSQASNNTAMQLQAVINDALQLLAMNNFAFQPTAAVNPALQLLAAVNFALQSPAAVNPAVQALAAVNPAVQSPQKQRRKRPQQQLQQQQMKRQQQPKQSGPMQPRPLASYTLFLNLRAVIKEELEVLAARRQGPSGSAAGSAHTSAPSSASVSHGTATAQQ